MKIKLFDKEIELRDNHCSLNNNCPDKADKYINIYVRLENTCNAMCKFCNFRGEKQEFDFYKFYYVINEIKKVVPINKISFTGGEPTTDCDMLHKCLMTVKEIDSKIFTVVNTNGYNLNKIASTNTHDLIDSIALSRHHYDDSINNSIFGTEVVSSKIIEQLNKMVDNKIHLSCNLVKGYIDSKEEILKYLNAAANIGIKDIGFISLMQISQYCKEKFIDFSDIDLKCEDVLINKEWNNENNCKCKNHMFIADNGEIVEFYSRYYSNSKNNLSSLVYDIDKLKDGFNGQVIL